MTQFTYYDDVRFAFQAQHGFNPTYVYCLNTGKQIGYLTESEYELLVDLSKEDDIESTCDNLWTRILVSLRPSAQWSMVQLDSLKQMLDTDRIGVLSYLLNRITAPASLKTASLEIQMSHRAAIIKRRIQLQQSTASAESINRLLLALLAFDSKFSLTRYDSSSWFRWPTADLDDSTVNQMANNVESREDALVEQAEKEAKRNRTLATYPDGNRLTRSAFTKTWLESPQTALSADRARKVHASQRPPSLRAAKLKAEDDLLATLMAELSMGNLHKLEQPIYVPATPRTTTHPRRFGVKTGA
jgi:hypothetical protein